MTLMRNFLRVLLIGLITTTASQSLASDVWRHGEFRGTVVLTVTENVGLPTRGGSSEDVDKFFVFNDIAFDKAAQFDAAALQALPQVMVNADFPKGGKVYPFEGPLLKDVLESVRATGETVTIRALDGYAVEIPLADAYAAGAIVALKREGIPFAIGDFGPTHVVFPRADRADLADMPDDWWVWSIYHIHVE